MTLQVLTDTKCPVCKSSVSSLFFDGGNQPLATLFWPDSKDAAQAMDRHPHDFVQCPHCSHVWNKSFDYSVIPYGNNPNRMFNQGGVWKGHLAVTRDAILAHLPENPTVIDIGCGDGHFVRGMADTFEKPGRFMGFDPNSTPEAGQGVEFLPRYFEPIADMAALQPNVIMLRHVLEHLDDPADFLEACAWGAELAGSETWLFAETPCIDRVFETDRLADFFYEHVSHFTTQSFRALMEQAGEIERLEHGYNGEVVYALVKLGVRKPVLETAQAARDFLARSSTSKSTIGAQLDTLASSGQSIAIWGGTGKAAAFIHQFSADADRFPTVVDSDPLKVGSFVPGTGQEIQSRDVLNGKVDIVIIPTQWRARDIAAEMDRESIEAGQILIEHNGKLVDFRTDDHPYR